MAPWAAYLVVFVASCCTLILELVAGRILAPYIGVSLYTWTSIIGVVLAGISLGNYLGGRVADRWPDRRTLGVLLAAGGLASLAILPLIGIATAINTAQLVDTADRLGGSLRLDRALILIARIVVITTVIFFPPSFILGMVSPVVVKLVLRDFAHTGGTVGKIYAVSTLGSILGTFITGFLLIQVLGTRAIVVGVAITLLLMALLFGNLLRINRPAAAALAAALVLVMALVPARNVLAYNCPDQGLDSGCLARAIADGVDQAINSGCLKETSYYCIKVVDVPDPSATRVVRELVLDRLVHSYNSVEDPNYLQYGYIKVYAEMGDYQAQRLPNKDLQVLNIGGGGYTYPRYVEANYPNARQTIMEIDPGITETVYDRLGVNRSTTNITTYNFDGRLMLNNLAEQQPKTFDMVIGDAFNDLSIPYHLTTKEFDQKLKSVLKDDGYYVTLVIDKMQGGKFITAYTRTVQQVWPYVAVVGDNENWTGTAASTWVVVAGNQPIDLNRLSQVRGQGPEGRTVTKVMPQDLMQRWLEAANPPILTDDYAPVDNLIAPIFAERGF